jgi:hypothetical protein
MAGLDGAFGSQEHPRNTQPRVRWRMGALLEHAGPVVNNG